MVLLPLLRATEFVDVLVEETPLTVQLVPPGIVLPPLTVYATLTGELVRLAPFAGEVTTTVGTEPRLTVTLTGVLVPNALVQDTGMVFAPVLSETELVEVLVEDAPLTVQVVPPGIVVDPLTV
jgi:hypothetical protein